MDNCREVIDNEFDNWKSTPPNMIQRGTGFVTKPIEYLLSPFIDKVTPLFEGVFTGSNNYIASALKSRSNDILDINELEPIEFENWFKEQDVKAKNFVTAGIASLTAEGGLTGLGGFALLAVDIPASFGLILGCANKIALLYQLDITDENVQVEVLKAISAGSETSIEGKTSAIATLKVASNIISKQTWKSMGQAAKSSMPGAIFAIRAFLKKLGVNVTKRKAAQLIPVVGAVSGAVINGSWASDSLEAVRQYSRKSIADNFYEGTVIDVDL